MAIIQNAIEIRPFHVEVPDEDLTGLRHRKGGHFAAWEQSQLFSEELRAAFRSLH